MLRTKTNITMVDMDDDDALKAVEFFKANKMAYLLTMHTKYEPDEK